MSTTRLVSCDKVKYGRIIQIEKHITPFIKKQVTPTGQVIRYVKNLTRVKECK